MSVSENNDNTRPENTPEKLNGMRERQILKAVKILG